MEGLRKMYYDPKTYGVLPFKHNYTMTGEETISAFFLPAFKTVKDMSLYDSRGYISDKVGKEYFDKTRALKVHDPQEYVTYCAEFCYNAEEAFSLEGDNKFNKVNIAEQLTSIRALKQCPKIDRGNIEYTYRNNEHIQENITGFKWIPNNNSNLQILEHPIWTLPDEKDNDGKIIKTYPKEKINNLYVIGVDGIDIGASQTSEYTKDPSDFCLVVYKRVYGNDTPKFVALYKDRPDNIHTAYKIAMKLAQYYNAKINIEATRMSFATWARDHKLLSFFMKRPRATLTDINRGVSKQYGTPATQAIIAHQTDLIADYVNDYCYNIWFEQMLDELNQYNDANKRKFDIIAAAGMALLADEELSGTVPKQVTVEADANLDIGYYRDENGQKHFGIIPDKTKITVNINSMFDYYAHTGYRTSDPRINFGALW